MGKKPVSGMIQKSQRQLLSDRLTEIQGEIADDYDIPAALWDQMLNALEKGSPTTGEPFTREELENFDDATRARLGSFLAEATRGMSPGKAGILSDSKGNVLGRIPSKDEARRIVEEERGA